MRWLPLLLLLLVPSAWGYGADGEEQRCTDLGVGTNCVCSTPLDASDWFIISADRWGTNSVTSTVRCTAGGPGSNIVLINEPDTGNGHGGFWPHRTGSVNATILSRLPASKTVSAFVQEDTNTYTLGNAGDMALGHVIDESIHSGRTKRRAFRMYLYHSDGTETGGLGAFNYGPPGDPDCNQATKWFDGGPIPGPDCAGSYITGSGGTWNALQGQRWGSNENVWGNGNYVTGATEDDLRIGQTSSDDGAAGAQQSLGNNSWKGAWWRIEVIIDNPGGCNPLSTSCTDGFRIRMYRKDVTNGTAEAKILDTYSATNCVHCAETHIPEIGIIQGVKNLTFTDGVNPRVVRSFNQNFYRQRSGNGQCVGTRAFSMMMVAAWSASDMAGYDVWTENDTAEDRQYRIGSALEIEGCAGEIDPGAECAVAGFNWRHESGANRGIRRGIRRGVR